MQHVAQLMNATKPLYGLGDVVNFRLEGDGEFIYGSACIIGIYKEPQKIQGDWCYMTHVISPEDLTCDWMTEDDITNRVIRGL